MYISILYPPAFDGELICSFAAQQSEKPTMDATQGPFKGFDQWLEPRPNTARRQRGDANPSNGGKIAIPEIKHTTNMKGLKGLANPS